MRGRETKWFWACFFFTAAGGLLTIGLAIDANARDEAVQPVEAKCVAEA